MLMAGAAIARAGGDARLEVRRDVLDGCLFAHRHLRARAAPLFRRALDRAQSAHLDTFEFIAYAHSGLADVAGAQGRFDEAIAQMNVCVRALEEEFGTEHVRVGDELTNFARQYLEAGRLAEALATAQRAVGIFETAVERGDIPASSDYEATAVQMLGKVMLRMGRTTDAIERLEHAAERYHAAGELTDGLAMVETERAIALSRLGRISEAKTALDEADEIERTVQGIPPEVVADTLAARATLEIKTHRPGIALPLAERALVLLDGGEPGVYELASTRLLVAHTLRGPPKRRSACPHIGKGGGRSIFEAAGQSAHRRRLDAAGPIAKVLGQPSRTRTVWVPRSKPRIAPKFPMSNFVYPAGGPKFASSSVFFRSIRVASTRDFSLPPRRRIRRI